VSTYRVRRGRQTETIVAARLAATIWPHAQPVGAGRHGADITGTPGVLVEVKARTRLDLGAALKQARGHGQGVALVVVRLPGAGPASVGDWPVAMRLDDVIDLLRAAGYGQPLPAAVPAVGVAAVEQR